MELIKTTKLRYMNAVIKEYDDGTEILQSYSTDVVKKTPEGKYIRLWHGWSMSTSKQVSIWCNRHFRSLPYEDGTYEDLTPEKRTYTKKVGRKYSWSESKYIYEPESRGYSNKEIYIKNTIDILKEALEEPQSLDVIFDNYYTISNKKVKETFKDNKEILDFITLLTGFINKAKGNKYGPLFRLYDYSFEKVWEKVAQNFSFIKPLTKGEN